MPRFAGWKGFLAWALAGGLLLFSFLSGFSIGLFLLPLALVALWLVARRARAWPELFGAGAGFGAICLLVAFLSRDYNPCPEGPITLRPGETEFECGGTDPIPWLVAGLALVVVSALAYALARRSRSGPPTPLGLSTGEVVALLLAGAVAVFGVSMVFGAGISEGGGAGRGVDVEVPVTTIEEPPRP